MTQLIKYDAACSALAAARSVDEVLEIRDKAEAIRAYARIAGNLQFEADAFIIRVRAEIKGRELLKAGEDAGEIAKSGGQETSIPTGYTHTPTKRRDLIAENPQRQLDELQHDLESHVSCFMLIGVRIREHTRAHPGLDLSPFLSTNLSLARDILTGLIERIFHPQAKKESNHR